MDQNSTDKIRSATFPLVRKGYDPGEVEGFLARLADWLETGGGDQARADVVRREIERVGEKTAAVLTSAEDTAQQLRGDAEREADEMVGRAQSEASGTREEADGYAAKVRGEADDYSAKLLGDADTYGAETRGAADTYAETTRAAADADAERKQTVAEKRAREAAEAAEAKAKRIVNDGARRRREIEAVIADLVGRRNAVITDANRLSEGLQAAAAAHTPKEGSDPFAKLGELDPVERGEPGPDDTASPAAGPATSEEEDQPQQVEA